MDFFQGLRIEYWGLGRGGRKFRFFSVSGVTTGVTTDNGILTRIGQHLKLVRECPTNRASVCFNRTINQSTAVEDASIGVEHILIFALAISEIRVEGVGVFHDEFPPAH